MIRLWRGFHSAELLPLIRNSLAKNELLILCPPGLIDFSFIDLLPEGQLEYVGDWQDAPVKPGLKARSSISYRTTPVLGVFTSGTVSGTPKLVLYSRDNIDSSLQGIRTFFETNRFDTIFCYPQPFHTFGLILGYVQAALYNLNLVTGEGKYTRAFHERRFALKDPKVLTLGIPTHFFDLHAFLQADSKTLAPSYSCIMGGAKVSVPLWKSVRDELHIEAPSIGYGATEACPGVTHQAPGKMPTEEGEIGTAIPGVTIRLHPGKGLEFTGPNACMTTIQNGAICFPENILLSDEVRLRNDGTYVYEGRTDLMLNRGGLKISLEKIEEKIRADLGIHSVCVRVPDKRLGEELGVLVLKDEKKIMNLSFNEKRVRVFSLIQKEFSQSFNPQLFIEIDRFPLNESSKIDRRAGARYFL